MTDKKPKTDLTQFIGISISALVKEGYTTSQTRNIVCADLIENALQVARKEDSTYDYYGLKPLFIALKYIFDNEIAIKQNDIDIPQIAQNVKTLEFISEYLDKRIRTIKEDRQ